MLDEIRGAVARGWCSKENEHKVMDSTLAEAISHEVNKLVQSKFTSHNKQSTPCCVACGSTDLQHAYCRECGITQ